jgi:hypothetical protein
VARKREPRTWPVQDAKARFSELLEASITKGPQIVTRRGWRWPSSYPSINGVDWKKPHARR